MTKALVSVTGSDATGIIAGVATKLSELEINILDISQTILGGYFTMLMVVDIEKAPVDFAGISEQLLKKITAAFGGKLRSIVCGGAPVPPEIVKDFYHQT